MTRRQEDEIEVCRQNPDQTLDVLIEAELGAFTKVWTRYCGLEEARARAHHVLRHRPFNCSNAPDAEADGQDRFAEPLHPAPLNSKCELGLPSSPFILHSAKDLG